MTENLIETEAAEALRVSPRTLQRWRVAGTGPAFILVGKRVLYAKADLEAFLSSRRRTSTSDRGVAA